MSAAMRRWRTVLCAGALWLAGEPAAAQTPELKVQVNYVYAAQFGFGSYDVGDLTVDVYTLPLAYTFKEIYRDWDLTLGLPIVYGHYTFRTTLVEGGQRFGIEAHQRSIAAEPRLRLQIPIIHHLWLSPFAAFGAGSTFDSGGRVKQQGQTRFHLNSDESGFYTYQGGYTLLYEYDWRAFTLFLGDALIGAGDDFFDDSNNTEAYGTLRNGIELRHPLGFEILHRVPDAGVFFIYDHFFPALQFTRVRRSTLDVDDLFEVGMTFGSATPLDLPYVGDMLDDLRLGVAYEAGDGLDAWKLTTGFPF